MNKKTRLKDSKQKLIQKLGQELDTVNHPNSDNKIQQIKQLSQSHSKKRHSKQFNLSPSNEPTLKVALIGALMDMNHKVQKYIYNSQQPDTANNILYKNDFSTLNALHSLHFAKIIKYQPCLHNRKEIKCYAKITPLGQQFIKQFFKNCNQSYQMYSKIIHKFWLWSLFPWILTCLILIETGVCFAFSSNYAVFVTIVTLVIIEAFYILYLIDAELRRSHLKIHFYRTIKIVVNLLKTSGRKTTEQNVLKFLRQNHIQEPDFTFHFNTKKPPLHRYLFSTPNQDITQLTEKAFR